MALYLYIISGCFTLLCHIIGIKQKQLNAVQQSITRKSNDGGSHSFIRSSLEDFENLPEPKPRFPFRMVSTDRKQKPKSEEYRQNSGRLVPYFITRSRKMWVSGICINKYIGLIQILCIHTIYFHI